MRVAVSHDLEVVILRVGALFISLINIRVSLVVQFMSYLSSLIEASLVTVIILAKVLFSL